MSDIRSETSTMINPGASSDAIRSHYDIGNPFYALWLDRELSYSAAMWEPDDTLDSAQLRKVDYHISQAGAEDAANVLDVGCGWGAVLKRLVEARGARRAVGLTLSNAQADRIRSFGNPQIDVRVESWSDHNPDARYDAIISIGAFEHFARLEASDAEKIQGYRAFFTRCREWLKPPGRLSLQSFAYGGVRSREQVRNSAGTHFLATEIFPETDPPRLTDIAAALDGIFEVVSLRNDRKDYGRTCREWLGRLRGHREQAIRIVGEETFGRYQRYLQLSTIAFETGNLALFRITLAPLR